MNALKLASWMESKISDCPYGDRTFFDTKSFPWVKRVESNWRAIRKEADVLLRDKEQIPYLQDISPEQSSIAQGKAWKSFFLFGFGNKIGRNCDRCPETTRIIEEIPGLKMAMFSILAAKSHILPHRGPYKGLLRYHLGLVIPEPNLGCRIRVADEIRCWQEGRSLIFDDSHDHEAWNDSDRDRVILFVDFLRPLPFHFSLLNSLTVWRISKSAFVTDAVARLRANQPVESRGRSDPGAA